MICIWELWKFWSNIRVIYTVSGRRTTGHGHGGPGGEKRKRRCMMATDSEWSRMRGKAQEEGTSCSEFIVRRCLVDAEPAAPEPALPAPVLRHIARSVLALGDMERLRSIREGSEGDWNAALERADRWLDGETALG